MTRTNQTERLKSELNCLDFGQRPKAERFDNQTKSENAEIRTFGFRTSTVYLFLVINERGQDLNQGSLDLNLKAPFSYFAAYTTAIS